MKLKEKLAKDFCDGLSDEYVKKQMAIAYLAGFEKAQLLAFRLWARGEDTSSWAFASLGEEEVE